MIIRVSPQDFGRAADIGVRRLIARMVKGYKPNGGSSQDHDLLFDNAVMGAVAEQEVARLLNLFWDPKIGEDTHGDVGGCVEVRCRKTRSGDEIGLHPEPRTKPNAPYVGMLWHGGFTFELTGWVRGHEGLAHGVWNENRQCFYVPRALYRPFSDLIALFGTNSSMVGRDVA